MKLRNIKKIESSSFYDGKLTLHFVETERTRHSPEEISISGLTWWQRFLIRNAGEVRVQGEPCGGFTNVTGVRARIFKVFEVSVWRGYLKHAKVDVI